jgi:hypothetical protein
MRRTAKIAMLSCGDFQEPKNVGRQEGVARRPKIGTEISNKRVRFYLNRKLEERIKFRCQVARPPRGLNSDPVDIVPQPVPFARIEHRKNSKAAKKALQVCGGLRFQQKQTPSRIRARGPTSRCLNLYALRAASGGRGMGIPSGSRLLNPKLVLRQLRIMPLRIMPQPE